ncbi:MAG: hypothetical protein AAFO94_10090 [Bacteroidota bacterium]
MSDKRILIILESEPIPAWQAWLVQQLTAQCQLSVAIHPVPGRQVNTLLGWHLQLDRRLFGPKPDAFALRPLDEHLTKVDWRNCPEQDLVLWLCQCPIPPALLTQSKQGVLFTAHGSDFKESGQALGYRATMHCREIISSSMWWKHGDVAICCKEWHSTAYDFNIARGRNEHFWQMASIYCNKALRVLQDKVLPIPVEGGLRHPINDGPISTVRTVGMPANVINGFRYGWRLFKKLFRKRIVREQWMLLLEKEKAEHSATWPASTQAWEAAFAKYHKLLPPKDVFWADPFLVAHEDRLFLFIEELPFATDRGYLSAMEVLKDGSVTPPKKILEKPYHLSYPFVFQYEDKYYMVPESYEDRSVQLYESVAFPYQWQFKKYLMRDVKAFDSTICFHEGRWWLFCTIGTPAGTGDNDALHLFYADSPISEKWTAHPLNPIVTDVRSARPAGKIFRSDEQVMPHLPKGSLIRPAQDCALKYGHGFKLMQIEELTPTTYRERELHHIRPNWDATLSRTHSFNHANGRVVIDAIRTISKR